MRHARLAIDPLWTCLCPSWTARNHRRAAIFLNQLNSPPSRCLHRPFLPPAAISTLRHGYRTTGPHRAKPRDSEQESKPLNVDDYSIDSLYAKLGVCAHEGRYTETLKLVEYILAHRAEEPNIALYNALILSNQSSESGAAWRVHKLLAEMEAEGLQPDQGTCQAVLKTLAVHPDHLLRSDILAYMREKWFTLSNDSAHDVAAGCIREGCLESALEQLESMRSQGSRVEPWLLDMFTYALCNAGEMDAAYQIAHTRWEEGELNLSRTMWHYLLDHAAEARHHPATEFVWRTQVRMESINASSGICLNVLTTASIAGDATLATETFTYLSKRGEKFRPIHYQLLIDAYMHSEPPDIKRALSILCIMPLEKLQPSTWQTRSLYLHLRESLESTAQAFGDIRDLHRDDRPIPIAVLNLIVESYIHQHKLDKAVEVYKQIHTFSPRNAGSRKSFADTATFNLLLYGCGTATPPDGAQASFLISEMLALHVQPDETTFDRLIVAFSKTAMHCLHKSNNATNTDERERELARCAEYIDWAVRHFHEVEPLDWFLPITTRETLASSLATLHDERCWNVIAGVNANREVKQRIEDSWRDSMLFPQHRDVGEGYTDPSQTLSAGDTVNDGPRDEKLHAAIVS